MENTFIEIQAWGDFDVSYTDCIMFCEGKRDVDSLTKTFCSLNGLPGTKGLPYNMLSDTTEEFKKFLKKEGFRVLKTKQIIFSD